MEVIAPLTTFHDMLLFGSTEPMRQAASGILTSLIEYDPQFGKQLSDTVIQGLRTFSKTVPAEHVVNLMSNVLRAELIKVQEADPQQGIKFIAETLLNLPDEQYHGFAMELLGRAFVGRVKIHGQYVLLQAFDHQSNTVRDGVQAVYTKKFGQEISIGHYRS